MAGQSVQIKLVLGHSAQWRKKPTSEGYTHDWTVLIRGEDEQEIKHFVEKVVFYLHESFPRPKRVLKDPPYQVSESGYGSFNLPVEVYFRNKDEPKKVKFDYDLLLPNMNDPPINQIRSECLTFQNPSEEFKQKLLKAGGMVSGGAPVSVNDSKPLSQKTKRPGGTQDIDVPNKKKKLEGRTKDSSGSKRRRRSGSSSSEFSGSDSSSDSESGNEDTSAPVTAQTKPSQKGNAKKSSPNNWDTTSLKRLHKQLNALQDPQQLQEIVNIIEQTGLYHLTASTFDFDLCKLDDVTLNKLGKFVEPSGTS